MHSSLRVRYKKKRFMILENVAWCTWVLYNLQILKCDNTNILLDLFQIVVNPGLVTEVTKS